MASTNKTPHLGLNQWVLTDPFLMDDFNADNAKLDTALNAVPCVKLLDITTQTDATQVDLDLSGLDLSRFVSLRVYTNMMLRDEITATTSSRAFAKINDLGGYCGAGTSTSGMSFSSYIAYWTLSGGGSDGHCGTGSMEITGLFPVANGKSSWLHAQTDGIGSGYSFAFSQNWGACYLDAGDHVRKISFFTDDAKTPRNLLAAGARFVVTGVRA